RACEPAGRSIVFSRFPLNAPAPSELSTLSLHDALPISPSEPPLLPEAPAAMRVSARTGTAVTAAAAWTGFGACCAVGVAACGSGIEVTGGTNMLIFHM